MKLLDQLKDLKDGEETVLVVHGESFVVSRATDDDIERIGKGYFCLD
ncbi:hypothetical protein [Cohnella cholangitidis]|nr:hypothetical protein [Cohnella cholangitidis]